MPCTVALLAEVDRQPEIEAVLGRLHDQCAGLIDLRLLGPLAAYDFVVAGKPAS